MRKILFLFILLTFAARLSAQEAPKAEIFGGYSFANEQLAGNGRANLNGWNASVAVNVNRWFGLVTDFGGVYGGSTTRTVSLVLLCPLNFPCPTITEQITFAGSTHSFLFGPQFSLRREKITPFVRFLVGGQRVDGTIMIRSSSPILIITSPFSSATSGFAFGVGGGMDYKFKSKLAWRVQADYLQSSTFNRPSNNFRISSGLVFHFE